jgi:hypothetical protein
LTWASADVAQRPEQHHGPGATRADPMRRTIRPRIGFRHTGQGSPGRGSCADGFERIERDLLKPLSFLWGDGCFEGVGEFIPEPVAR